MISVFTNFHGLLNLLFLCFAGFLAAFVDAIAGGGGLISMPAFLMAGISPHLALGTNKFAASCGSCTSSFKYWKSGKVDFKVLKFLLPFSLLGSIFGVTAVLHIDESHIYMLVLILILFVGIYSLFSKSLGLVNKFKGLTKKNLTLGILLAFALGFYDGFFGPGTGSFLMFGLISIFGFDYTSAAGNTKVLNFTSNISALVLFAIHNKIYYLYGIPVAIFMILGARFGAKMALTKGSKLIKPIFVTISLAVALKMLFKM